MYLLKFKDQLTRNLRRYIYRFHRLNHIYLTYFLSTLLTITIILYDTYMFNTVNILWITNEIHWIEKAQ